MNSQNPSPNPAAQPANAPAAAQPYGAGAQARAMMASRPMAMARPQPSVAGAPAAMPATNPAGAMAGTQATSNPALANQATPAGFAAGQPLASQQLAVQPEAAPTGAAVAENPLSTQATLMFSELRDGLVIMKDGSFRAVVACQSINFDLMSETEREGVEYSYQNFLNSLNFNVQILIRSQRVDIGPYIERLVQMRRSNDNMLLGVLMDDYINFIDILAQEANIMDKSFFIVIPYFSSPDMEQAMQQTKNFFKAFGNTSKQPTVTRINRDTYNKAIDELNNRVETVISGLFQIGIHSVRLNTKELSELFYNFNNPDTAVREPLVDFTKMATTYVQKGTRSES